MVSIRFVRVTSSTLAEPNFIGNDRSRGGSVRGEGGYSPGIWVGARGRERGRGGGGGGGSAESIKP